MSKRNSITKSDHPRGYNAKQQGFCTWVSIAAATNTDPGPQSLSYIKGTYVNNKNDS